MTRAVRVGLVLVSVSCGWAAPLSRAAEPGGAFATGRVSQPVRGSRQDALSDQGQDRAELSGSCFTATRKIEAVYFAARKNANGPLAQIRDIGSGDVRSEGMSYGMMIAVQLDKRAEFDAL